MNKTAIIIGSEGQDGKILFDQLCKKNFSVIGIDQNKTRTNNASWQKCVNICNSQEVLDLISNTQPEEVYHLAAFHHSSEEKTPEDTNFYQKSFDVNFFSLINLLEAIRLQSINTRLFYASSSHVFGDTLEEVQTEATCLNPNTVYGITKATAQQACRLYRQKYNIFASTGILYTHESKFRSEKFLSQKVIRAAIDFKFKGRKEKLVIGDLSAVVDWGFAPEFTEAAQLIVRHSQADDFIVATNHPMKISDFIEHIFAELGLDWTKFVEEKKGILNRSGIKRIGSYQKINKTTGWQPTTFGASLAKILLQTTLESMDK